LLLVANNRADRVLLTEALTEATHKCAVPVQLCTVADGRAALAFLPHEGPYRQARRPDLIVLDLHGPELSGPEVLAQLKSEAQLKPSPVVILTSSTAPEDSARSYHLGAKAYVHKSVELEEFFCDDHSSVQVLVPEGPAARKNGACRVTAGMAGGARGVEENGAPA
jgi:CheY-like chemotaxis protein